MQFTDASHAFRNDGQCFGTSSWRCRVPTVPSSRPRRKQLPPVPDPAALFPRQRPLLRAPADLLQVGLERAEVQCQYVLALSSEVGWLSSIYSVQEPHLWRKGRGKQSPFFIREISEPHRTGICVIAAQPTPPSLKVTRNDASWLLGEATLAG